MEEPFVPFTRPYGMSEEEFEEEVRIAQDFHDLWLYQQQFQNIQDNVSDEDLWYEILFQEEMIQNNLNDLYHYSEDGFCDGFTKF